MSDRHLNAQHDEVRARNEAQRAATAAQVRRNAEQFNARLAADRRRACDDADEM